MKKFVIYSLPRSSTEWICKKLNSLPTVRCHGEIFGAHEGRPYLDEQKIYDKILSSHNPRHDFLGFKVFPDQFYYRRTPQKFFVDNDIHPFVYIREDIIGAILSYWNLTRPIRKMYQGVRTDRVWFNLYFFTYLSNYELLYTTAKENNYDLIHLEKKKQMQIFSEYFNTEIDFSDVTPYPQRYKLHFNQSELNEIQSWLDENLLTFYEINYSLPDNIIENLKRGIV